MVPRSSLVDLVVPRSGLVGFAGLSDRWVELTSRFEQLVRHTGNVRSGINR